MNTYKAISGYGKATFGEDQFEAEFSASEERDLVDSGHVEIVPRTYKVLSNNYSGAPEGETFEGALLIELEAALIQGGHIERADKPATTTKKKG